MIHFNFLFNLGDFLGDWFIFMLVLFINDMLLHFENLRNGNVEINYSKAFVQ